MAWGGDGCLPSSLASAVRRVKRKAIRGLSNRLGELKRRGKESRRAPRAGSEAERDREAGLRCDAWAKRSLACTNRMRSTASLGRRSQAGVGEEEDGSRGDASDRRVSRGEKEGEHGATAGWSVSGLEGREAFELGRSAGFPGDEKTWRDAARGEKNGDSTEC